MKKIEFNISSKETRRLLLKILGCLIVVVALLGGYTYSRYANDLNSDRIMGTPDNFFFESDFLTVNNTSHEMQNYNKDKDYNFAIDIRNFQDTLRPSAMDITYTLSISNFTGTGTNGIQATLGDTRITNSNTEFTLTSGSTVTNQLLITVPAGYTVPSNEIKISATAKPTDANGYTKTISGTFKLVENTSTFDIELENHRDYYDLLIGVAKDKQNMTVTWPSWLTPDTTIEELKSASTTSASYQTNGQDSSVRLRFFVTGTVNTTDKITVTDGQTGTDHTKTIAIKDAR